MEREFEIYEEWTSTVTDGVWEWEVSYSYCLN